jgi:hypothetical protein
VKFRALKEKCGRNRKSKIKKRRTKRNVKDRRRNRRRGRKGWGQGKGSVEQDMKKYFPFLSSAIRNCRGYWQGRVEVFD